MEKLDLPNSKVLCAIRGYDGYTLIGEVTATSLRQAGQEPTEVSNFVLAPTEYLSPPEYILAELLKKGSVRSKSTPKPKFEDLAIQIYEISKNRSNTPMLVQLPSAGVVILRGLEKKASH